MGRGAGGVRRRCAPGATATADELIEHCRGQLAKFKVPKDVTFIDALPRNPSGKVLKRELREDSVTDTITTVKLTESVGAEVRGVDVERLLHDDDLPAWVLDTLEANGVLVFRDLHLDDATQVAFSKRLGHVEVFGTGELPEIFLVTLDPARNQAAAYLRGTFDWHIDGLTDDIPIKATLLAAHGVADSGARPSSPAPMPSRGPDGRGGGALRVGPRRARRRGGPATARARPVAGAAGHVAVEAVEGTAAGVAAHERPVLGRARADPRTTSSAWSPRRAGPSSTTSSPDRRRRPTSTATNGGSAIWSSGTTRACCTGPCRTIGVAVGHAPDDPDRRRAHPLATPAERRAEMARIEPIPIREWPPEMRAPLAAMDPPEPRHPKLSPEASRPKALNLLGTFAHHTALAHTLFDVYNGPTSSGRPPLSERQRELLVLRVAARLDCPYEWAQHVAMAGAAGLTEEEIAGAGSDELSPDWSPLDAGLLTPFDELVAGGVITDDTWKVVAAKLDAQQLLDVIYTVGAYQTLAWMVRSLDVPVDDDLVEFLPPDSDG